MERGQTRIKRMDADMIKKISEKSVKSASLRRSIS